MRLPDRLELNLKPPAARGGRGSNTWTTLQHPTLIGAGSGGAVFRWDAAVNNAESSSSSTTHQPNVLLLKVSWPNSTPSVQRECQILQRLEQQGIVAVGDVVEQCWGQFPYPAATSVVGSSPEEQQQRIMIVLTPYAGPYSVTSVEDVSDVTAQRAAVQHIATTIVQMLAANTVTVDVQPLIDPSTGQVLFIDLTEAQELQVPYSDMDLVLLRSFVTEMWTLIPERFAKIAASDMVEEITVLESRGIALSHQAKEVLDSFVPE